MGIFDDVGAAQRAIQCGREPAPVEGEQLLKAFAQVAQLVIPAPLHGNPPTEDSFDRGTQRLGAVDHEQPALARGLWTPVWRTR